MKKIIAAACLITASLASVGASAQESYKPSSKAYTMEFPTHDWDGKAAFTNVYCATFPEARKAERLLQMMFNNNAIYFANVLYPDGLSASIVVSTIPPGRSSEEDIRKLLDQELRSKGLAPAYYEDVKSIQTNFGLTTAATLKDFINISDVGPFPLSKKALKDATGRTFSVGATRLFARGPDRFEIGTLQMFDKAPDTSTVNASRQKVDTLANDLMAALQDCTAKLPVRVPKPQTPVTSN